MAPELARDDGDDEDEVVVKEEEEEGVTKKLAVRNSRSMTLALKPSHGRVAGGRRFSEWRRLRDWRGEVKLPRDLTF
jgi:hypothetical protein